MLKKLFGGPEVICPLHVASVTTAGVRISAPCDPKCAWLLSDPGEKSGICAIAKLALVFTPHIKGATTAPAIPLME